MMKHWRFVVLLVLIFALIAGPVSAASGDQQGGGPHFGPYTLSSGNSVSGDLAVFGPVMLEEDSEFDGDLTVFGEVTIEEGATLEGTLVVLGAIEIAGTVDGDVFSAGAVQLEDTAYVNGDVSAIGTISQDEGAVVEGSVTPMDEGEFNWDGPNIELPGPIVGPQVRVRQTPFWARGLWAFISGIANIVVMSLLSLVIMSIWPQQTERVSRAIEEAPLTAFGMGFLSLLLTMIVFVLLAITLCLLPLGIIGLIIVVIGVLLGWVALGLILGKRVLSGLFSQSQSNTIVAAIVGTGLLGLLLALGKIFWPIHSLVLFVLVPPAAGAVLLTRFGSMPYATQGRPVAPAIAPPSAPAPPDPIKPASLHEESPADNSEHTVVDE